MCTCSDLSSHGWLVQRNCWGRGTCIYPPNFFSYKFNNGRLLRLPMLVLNNYTLFFPPDFPNIDYKFPELVMVNLLLYKTNTITNKLQTSLQINTCKIIIIKNNLIRSVIQEYKNRETSEEKWKPSAQLKILRSLNRYNVPGNSPVSAFSRVPICLIQLAQDSRIVAKKWLQWWRLL